MVGIMNASECSRELVGNGKEAVRSFGPWFGKTPKDRSAAVSKGSVSIITTTPGISLAPGRISCMSFSIVESRLLCARAICFLSMS